MTDGGDTPDLDRHRDHVHVLVGLISIGGGVLIMLFAVEGLDTLATLTGGVVTVLDGVLLVYLAALSERERASD